MARIKYEIDEKWFKYLSFLNATAIILILASAAGIVIINIF